MAKVSRFYGNPDFIGVQLGGAVKNVIAIGAGMSDGIGFGANARTALITVGWLKCRVFVRRSVRILPPLSAWRGLAIWCLPVPTTGRITAVLA